MTWLYYFITQFVCLMVCFFLNFNFVITIFIQQFNRWTGQRRRRPLLEAVSAAHPQLHADGRVRQGGQGVKGQGQGRPPWCGRKRGQRRRQWRRQCWWQWQRWRRWPTDKYWWEPFFWGGWKSFHNFCLLSSHNLNSLLHYVATTVASL